MPELPEVEVIVKGLNKNILNLKILDFKLSIKIYAILFPRIWKPHLKTKP